MKTLNFEQMENLQGGLDGCVIAKGVTGGVAAGLLLGFTLCCPLAAAAAAAFAVTAAYCEVTGS